MLNLFISPHNSIQDPIEKFQARFISGIIIFLFMFIGLDVFISGNVPAYFLILFIIIYIISRTQYFYFAGILSIIAMAGSVLQPLLMEEDLSNTNVFGYVAWLVPGIILSGIILNGRQLFLVTTAHAIFPSLISFLGGPKLPSLFILEYISYIIVVSSLVMLSVGIRNRLINTMVEQAESNNRELKLAYETTLEGWAKALELRDKETVGHSKRVTELAVRFGQALNLSDEELDFIRFGALLHDIGKMGIPDVILNKPAELNETERKSIEEHPKYAYDLLKEISFLKGSIDIPHYHHERWDGNGYPRKLKEREIPLIARIFTFVDIWDALNSDRPYRNAWKREEVIKYIQENSGKIFDPDLVEVFLKLL